MPKLTYENRMRLWLVAGVAVTIVFGLVAGEVARIGEAGEYFWVIFPALILLAALVFSLLGIWWRALDDVQKSGQTNSWYWGGSAGALVFFLWLIADRAQHSEYAQGAFAMFVAQVIGFAVVWGAWKVRGMGKAE